MSDLQLRTRRSSSTAAGRRHAARLRQGDRRARLTSTSRSATRRGRRAMPEWFESGGRRSEQRAISRPESPRSTRSSRWSLHRRVGRRPGGCEEGGKPGAEGFSIGIESPRVVRDQKAANGRIIDGQIVEVSLVDHPANPNAKLVLAKS